MAKKLAAVVPKKITAAVALLIAQEYVELRERRLAEQKKVDALETQEKGKKKLLMDMLVALKINSVGDTDKIYALVTQDEPTVEDWEKLYSYIQKTGEFDLLYRRVNSAAVKERWEQSKAIPGITKFPAISLSVTRSK